VLQSRFRGEITRDDGATKNARAKRSRLSDFGIGFGSRRGTVSVASSRYEGVVDTFV
jgi:hypothetical protein